MDLLQIALVFLVLLLSIFLSILGIQVFFILRDLKKSLDRFDLLVGSVQQHGNEAIGDSKNKSGKRSQTVAKSAKKFFKRG